jgi:hypothetical protein
VTVDDKATIRKDEYIMKTTEEAVVNRMLSIKEAQAYLGLSHNTARAFCEKANAIVRIGGRVLVDRFSLDNALDKLREENNK